MLLNYFKSSARNLLKSKLHTIINTLSLSIGIACGILILLFINEELTFDRFHTNADRIYRVWMEEHYEGGQDIVNSVTPLILEKELMNSFPEIEAVTQYHPNSTIVRIGEDAFNESLSLVSPDFFKIFDFNVISGSVQSVFNNQNDIVLSRDHAIKYYGLNDPIGEIMEVQIGNNYYPMSVKAVVEVPSNSSLQFDLLISNENNNKLYRERIIRSWFNVITDTYLLTSSPMKELEAKFPAMVQNALGEDYREGSYIFHLQPLTDIHLNTDIPTGNVQVSDPRYGYILGFIALFIILLGSINFVTLSVGRSVYRAKEVGVRKVSGASRSQLTTQFLTESFLIALLSGLFGLVLTYMVLPVFNELANRELDLSITPFMVIIFSVLVVMIGLGAGTYPAIVLAGFKPAAILKGNVNVGRGRQNFRKGMVIVQFVISIFLLTTTLLMQRQLDYIQNKNLGYDKESVLTVMVDAPFQGGLFATLEKANQSALLFKQELENIPDILSVGIAHQRFGDPNWIAVGFHDQTNNYKSMNHTIVDFDLFETMALEIVAGRPFDENISSDATTAVIVNEAAVRYFNWEKPLEERFDGRGFSAHQIIGVVKDFNYQTLHDKVEPLAISVNPELILRGAEDVSFYFPVAPYIHLKAYQGNIPSVIEEMKSTWEKVFPNQPFAYEFLDESLRALYEQEESLRKVVTYSSALAIIIGALGLFGLVTLALNGRVKEIGIRKVLGASSGNLFLLLSKDYIVMLLLALLVSIPLSVYFIRDWLSSFEYRIGIPLDVFVVAGITILSISILTISYNVWKASRIQPVESLKYE